jgi:CheY-like chemotaxis protein
LLTGILGNAQLLDLYLQGDPRDGPSPERLRQMIDDIQKASGRAADLTRQLLSFSRKARLQSVPVDIHEIIEEVVGLLSHSIDRRIEIKIRLNAPRHVVKGDPTQIQNALLNLGLNARDAMPEGGVLTYETAVERIDQSFHRAGDEELSPGEYLRIRVIDTGVGMDRQLQQRVFEPFFTTKKEGRGTGLGLAAVYGCAKNHHGCVRLESEPGKGSTFLVYLPALGETTGVESVGAKVALKSGRGRVLVVDDEPIVRNFVVNILEELGYAAHACVDGLDAVEWFALNHSRVDLVILDIIMPRMNGEQAFRKLREIEPHIPVLIVSGYSQRHSIRDLLDHGARAFLSKPFQVTELAQSVSSHIRRSSC